MKTTSWPGLALLGPQHHSRHCPEAPSHSPAAWFIPRSCPDLLYVCLSLPASPTPALRATSLHMCSLLFK